MSIFSGPREISLSHWRYRLLHWCFNEKDVTCPAESALPQYLYCHYCPLFHLTNFIAFFSWLILAIKMTVWCCKGICAGISMINWSFLTVDISRFFRRRPREEREPTEEERIRMQWLSFKAKAKDDDIQGRLRDFEDFWSANTVHFPLLDKQEAEVLFEELKEKFRLDRIRRENRHRRIELLIHFSRRIFKGLIYVVYVVAAGGVFLLVKEFSMPVFNWFGGVFGAIGEFFGWLFSLGLPDFMPFLIIGGQVLGAIFLLTGLILLIQRFGVMQTCGNGLRKIGYTCVVLPLFFLTSVIGFPFVMMWKLVMVTKKFIGEFYENHCPPIIIVDVNEEVAT